jgi:hypothetical protein
MGLEHLQDKRTGRPRGSKSSPRWLRDAHWAYRNLGKPDSEPPTALAGLLVALGREHPDRFAACLATLDSQMPKAGKQDRDADDAPLNGSGETERRGVDDGRPQRLKTVTVREADLFALLRKQDGGCKPNPPADAYVVACKSDSSQRTVVLTISSVTFPEVAEGEPVPYLEREFDG